MLGVVLVLVTQLLPVEYTDGYFSPNGLYQALSFLALLQFVTAILNILPVPGFDGFGVIAPYLSPQLQRTTAPMRGWAPLVVFVLLFSFPQVAGYLFDLADALMDLFATDFTRYAAGLGGNSFRFWR